MKALHTITCCALLVLCSCASSNVIHGIPNFAQVEPGVWRGGQPVSDEGWRYLSSELHVWKVVKLDTREEGSDAKAVANGMHVVYIPITLAQQTVGKPSPGALTEAVAAIERSGTFVHCEHGQDRTGLVIGAYRVRVEHWTKNDAYAEMAAYGFHPWLRGLYSSWEEDVR